VDGANAGTWVTARNLTYAKVYNASHMVPYDLPIVSHDMMLRFMGVDISKIADGAAKVPSNIGSSTKPALEPTPAKDAAEPTGVSPTSTKTAEQDKAMWEGQLNHCSKVLLGLNAHKLTTMRARLL
jgi:carboxypeptidase D